jgi:hypothetical protein
MGEAEGAIKKGELKLALLPMDDEEQAALGHS